MRVLSIGTDRRLFEEKSASRARHEAYAKQFGALDSIVFTRGGGESARSEALSITPTNSRSRFLYGLNAFLIARKLPKPDVITTQDPFETGLVALFIARWLRVPLHVQVHTDLASPAFVRHSVLNRLRRACGWFVLRRASRTRVILERTKDALRARGIPTPITVLPIFVDTERLVRIPRVKHPRFKIALLCIGRLEKEKRLSLAIDALHAAREAGHDAGLTFVGSGIEERSLRADARRRGLEHFVDFAGWHDDIMPYLSAADILLVTSKYEGYGMAIIEALAAGVPVLSTDVGVAREAGAMVASASEFSRALLKWISNGPRRGELHEYPYRNFTAYAKAYCDDIAATR
jgi:glycosyltransferase involved in cell wall biosynthesis